MQCWVTSGSRQLSRNSSQRLCCACLRWAAQWDHTAWRGRGKTDGAGNAAEPRWMQKSTLDRRGVWRQPRGAQCQGGLCRRDWVCLAHPPAAPASPASPLRSILEASALSGSLPSAWMLTSALCHRWSRAPCAALWCPLSTYSDCPVSSAATPISIWVHLHP